MFADARTYIRFNKTWEVDVPLDGRMFILYGMASVPEGFDIKTSPKIVPVLHKVLEADRTHPGSRWPWGRPHKIQDEEEIMGKYRDIFQDLLATSLEDELTPKEVGPASLVEEDE